MKIPFNWLKKYISFSESVQQIAEILILAGVEVESIDGISFLFTGVVTAKIIRITPHPDASRLQTVQVFDGKDYYQVVCGDLTIREGMLVPFAKVGARLGTLEIKPVTLRGVSSEGMLAAKEELGLSSTERDGVWDLPDDAPLGKDLAEYLYHPILDVTLTPNLGFCRSIYGIARELSVHLQTSCTLPAIQKLPGVGQPTTHLFTVKNLAPHACPLYMTRFIRGVKIQSSPPWLVSFLEEAGMQSINNVVDITNYVMLELGQPLHAFDANKLPDKTIVIRHAPESFIFTTLDEKTREIPAGTLLIQSGDTPVALAGIMGGKEASVTTATTDILLESAIFTPQAIRQKSRLLGLRSESSSRFENEVDRGGVERAMDRAIELLTTLAEGTPASDSIVHGSTTPLEREIVVRTTRINDLLGIRLSHEEITDILSRIECSIQALNDTVLKVIPPSYRNDLQEEIDIVEEVGRVYGYNRIPRQEPLFHASTASHHPFFFLERKIRGFLVAQGLQEFITCNLISPKMRDIELDNGLSTHETIRVLSPSSQDQSILRSSFLPGHLTVLSHNLNNKQKDIGAFEIGNVHFHEGHAYEEKLTLGITLTGNDKPHHFAAKPHQVNFYDLKGIVENLFSALSIDTIFYQQSAFKGFHPFQQASIHCEEYRLGVIGQVHTRTLNLLGIDQAVFFCEIDVTVLLPHINKTIKQTPLPQFPSSERDLTLKVAKTESMRSLMDMIHRHAPPFLESVALLDIYEHPSLGEHYKNVTFRFTYRDTVSTLDYETIEAAHKELVEQLKA